MHECINEMVEVFRSIEVITPKGSIVNPKFPATVSNANINTSQRITDALFGALAKALPERDMAACCGIMNLFTIGGKIREMMF